MCFKTFETQITNQQSTRKCKEKEHIFISLRDDNFAGRKSYAVGTQNCEIKFRKTWKILDSENSSWKLAFPTKINLIFWTKKALNCNIEFRLNLFPQEFLPLRYNTMKNKRHERLTYIPSLSSRCKAIAVLSNFSIVRKGVTTPLV